MDNRRIKTLTVKKQEVQKNNAKPTEQKRREYKDYPLPIVSFIGYLVFAVLSVFLLISLGNYLIISDELFDTSGFKIFYNSVFLSIAAFILLGVSLFLSCFISNMKECRGKGLMRLLIIISFLIPITYIAFRIYVYQNELYFLDFQMITFTITTIMVFAFSLLKTILFNNCICAECGLMNTFILESSQTTDNGIKHKFHNEGGYTRSSTSTVNACVDGSEVSGTITTEEYVPKTTVYDGTFRSYTTNREYRCSHCGNRKTSSNSYEKKID